MRNADTRHISRLALEAIPAGRLVSPAPTAGEQLAVSLATGTSAAILGVCTQGTEAGEQAQIQAGGGLALVRAESEIAGGDELEVGALGRFRPRAAGRPIAIALSSAEAGEMVEIELAPAGLATGPDVSTVASLAALAAVDSSIVRENSRVWVDEVNDFYTLTLPAPETPDGVSSVAALNSAGSWVADSYGRWDDLQGPIIQGSGTGLTTAAFPNATSPFQAYYARSGQTDVLSFYYQLPHRWDGGPVFPHLHVVACADPGGATRNVYLDYAYQWMRFGDTFTTPYTSWPGGAVNYSVTPENWNKHQAISFGAITPPADSPDSTFLLFCIRRVGGDAADTYSQTKGWGTGLDNLMLLSGDLHFRWGKSGSLSQFYIPTP